MPAKVNWKCKGGVADAGSKDLESGAVVADKLQGLMVRMGASG